MNYRLRTLLIPGFLRFRLRALFLVVTVVCCFLAYEANWIRERRWFLQEQASQHTAYDKVLMQGWNERLAYLANAFNRSHTGLYCRPPGFLWLFSERGYGHVFIFISESDAALYPHPPGNFAIHPTRYLITSTQSDYVRAKRLFPEAKVYPFVHVAAGIGTATNSAHVKDATTGKIIVGWEEDFR